MSYRNGLIGVVVLLLACAPLRAMAAETLVLKSGARITGEVVTKDDADEDSVTIKTADGVRLTLAKSDIKQRLRQRPGELEYEKIRTRYADTVEGQWALAEWCRERNLTAQRETHLKRILELDPNHEKAHAGLGHSRIGGQWTTQEEVMRKQGMVFYKGRWRLPQEKELEEEKRRAEMAEKEWKKKLKMWRVQLGTNRDALARDSIRSIKSPMAARALSDAMREESDPRVRHLYVDALAQINSDAAREYLMSYSVLDHNEEVRLTCLDYVLKSKGPDTVKFYVARLRDPDNQIVNRAGSALKDLGDKSAIGPLIDALVTVHKEKVNKGNPGQIGATFGNSGPGGLSMGGGGVVLLKYHLQNRSVLEALVGLAGGPNFGFNVDQWKEWYVAQRKSQIIGARRDGPS